MSAESTDFDRLLRFATAHVDKFGLALASCDDDDARSQAIARVGATLAGDGRRFAELVVDATRPILDQLRGAVGAASPVACLSVLGMDSLLLDLTGRERPVPEIDELNRSRDRLPSEVPTRVLVWLSTDGILALARAARDLTDVVLTRFELPRTARAPVDTTVLARLQESARELLSRDIEAVREPSFRRHFAQYRMRNVSDAVEVGEFDEAEFSLQDMIAVYETVGDRPAEVRARYRLADIAILRGDLVGAMRILREEVHPLVIALGDRHLLVQCETHLAELLWASGDAAEALTLLRGSVISQAEAMGDRALFARGSVIIAGIMVERGQRAAAHRLLASLDT